MAIITMWRRPNLRCVLTVNDCTSTIRLITSRRVVRQQPVKGADEALAVAHQWEAEQPITKVEAALEALAIARSA